MQASPRARARETSERSQESRTPGNRRLLRLAPCLLLVFLLDACALPGALRLPSTRRLEGRVQTLESRLRHSQQELEQAESRLSSYPTRAAAVSTLVEARIRVESAERLAPWRKQEIADAHRKLRDADRQMRDGHFGAAMFFADRALRIANRLHRDAG